MARLSRPPSHFDDDTAADVAWQARAACHGMDPEAFYGPPCTPIPVATLLACSVCPVRNECLDYALSHRIEDGVWGGLSPKKRRKVRRDRAQMAWLNKHAAGGQ